MAPKIHAENSDTFYVSPDGNDGWTGVAPDSDERGGGPFATVKHAQDVLRELKRRGQLAGPMTVYLRGGRYPVEAPLVFTPEDSGPITYAAYEDETPIIDGGRKIDGWQTETVNGAEAWVTEISDVAEGKWYFRQLFVDGERRERPRLPKKGLYRITDVPGMPLPSSWHGGGYDKFRLGPGEMKPWRNLTDVEIIAFHFWIDERFPVAAFDVDTELIHTARTSRAPLTEAHGSKLAPCYIENVFEALTEPGEWYLDRAAGKLYYLPKPGETPENTEVFAPRAMQLLRLDGAPEDGRFVEYLRFEGLHFEHTDWVQPGDPGDPTSGPGKDSRRSVHRYSRGRDASASQAAADVGGVVALVGARYCSITDCRIAHVGWYGVEIADGCLGNRLVGNEITDLGGGGVKLNGAAWGEPHCLLTGNNRITDNHIHQGGRVFHASVGILSMHSFGNTLSHNHIHDLYYSGISCGWVWGYTPSISRDNHIEKNHIHNLGQGLLSDMGGIYTLGVQPGSVLRGNLIHHVEKLNYGAWCIYPDEGSSHLLIENNVCYRTNGEIFHQHYGRENIVRNNIFAFGGESVSAHGRADLEHKAFSFERNIFITDGPPIFKAGYGASLVYKNIRSDLNLFWHTGGDELCFRDRGDDIDLEGWRELGHDHHSLVADPRCQDPAQDDYALADDSPAVTELDFAPIDLSDVGPRPPAQRD